MGECRDCKWWTDDPRHDIGAHADIPEGRKACALTIGPNQRDEESLATAFDGEDYFAVLMTSPDFGCNQFEPKD